MGRRGRAAALPEEPHQRPAVLEEGSLVVKHRDAQGRVRSFDFGVLPVPEPFQQSLATLVAAKCAPGGGWDSIETSEAAWYIVRPFAEFLAGLDDVPGDVDRLTAAHWTAWRLSLPPRSNGYTKYSSIAGLLQMDPRLARSVREAMVKRFAWTPGHEQAYGPEEFQQIRLAARRTFRAALLRIRENTGHLTAWREGRIEAGSTEWLLGEALDVLARTGDVPVYDNPRTVRKRYRRALVGGSAERTWGRLYLSRKEVAALAVLIIVELGLNVTTVSEMDVPEILPGTAEGGMPVYRLKLEKRRRAGHRGRFESRNLTDSGADSLGRIITEALEATAHTRALLAQLDPQSAGRLLAWRQTTPHDAQAYPKAVRVGPFGFGVDETAGGAWARSVGLSGSPLRRLRKTVNVLHRREPGQHTQDTHDSVYVLPEPQAQQAAVPVIAEGALGAVADAHRTVFAARLAEAGVGERETATAGCADYEHSPFSPPGQGCTASFLLCTACPNARVTPAHHPRLAHPHQALGNLRGVLEPAVWEADWADAHARLDDLRDRLGQPVWEAALAAVGGTDRLVIDQLLHGDYDL